MNFYKALFIVLVTSVLGLAGCSAEPATTPATPPVTQTETGDEKAASEATPAAEEEKAASDSK